MKNSNIDSKLAHKAPAAASSWSMAKNILKATIVAAAAIGADGYDRLGVGAAAKHPNRPAAPPLPAQPHSRALQAMAPAPRIAFPVTVHGTHLNYATGDIARLYGVNLSPNDACGTVPRNTSTTEAVYRAAAFAGANLFVDDVFYDLSMADNATKLDFIGDLSRFVLANLPETLVVWRPLTDDVMDARGAPTDATCRLLANVAAQVLGNPNVGIAVAKELHRSKADYFNNVGNDEINSALRAQLTKAYQAIRAVNPNVLVAIPALLDSSTGVQYSRSLQAWVGNTAAFNNTVFTSDLYTTETTDAGQKQQVQNWVGQYSDKLPIMVTEMAQGLISDTGANMSDTVFLDTYGQLVANQTPTALWNWEYACEPSAVLEPIVDAQSVALSPWGQEMAKVMQQAKAGAPIAG